MFMSALTQYNASARDAQLQRRVSLRIPPGSELFVVYSDTPDTTVSGGGFPQLMNRAFIVTITRIGSERYVAISPHRLGNSNRIKAD